MIKGKVLIVDDDKWVRETLAEFFDVLGYQPFVAINGAEGLAYLETEQMNLVIADIKMPIMDGIEMTRRIKEKHPSLDVILISGYQPDTSWDDLMKSGASDYITKPFSIDMIERKVRNLIERRAGQKTNGKVRGLLGHA